MAKTCGEHWTQNNNKTKVALNENNWITNFENLNKNNGDSFITI